MNPVHPGTAGQAALYDRACRRMAELVPGWSDAIPSDPAAAILELASFLSDLQNRRLEAVGPAHFTAYGKLLGGELRDPAPAVLLARPAGAERPWPGQRFSVDGVPFEVVHSGGPEGGGAAVLLEGGGVWRGEAPLPLEGSGPALRLAFSRPLPGGVPLLLWCGLVPEAGRTPPEEETPPPVSLRAQVPAGAGWRDVPVEDGTCGLLRSGFLRITPDRDAGALRLFPEGALEGRPQISCLVPNPVRLEQRRTRSALADLTRPFLLPRGWLGNRVLRYFLPLPQGGWREAPELCVRDGRVTGWQGPEPERIRVAAAEPDFSAERVLRPIAGEELSLGEAGVLPDSLGLMVEEAGIWHDCPIREPDPRRTLPRGCRRDPETGLLRFGDGRDFRVPAGGRLLVVSCRTTEGGGGNGAAGLLEQDGVRLQALGPAEGGRDGETARDAFLRAAREQAEPLRAATLRDYEDLARRTPGLALRRVRAVPRGTPGSGEAGVAVLAEPVSREPLPKLTAWQRERLQTWLERFRLIGVPVEVRSPRYLPLEVEASLRTGEPVDVEAVREAVLRLADGVAGPLDFGAEISRTALFAALEALEGVAAVAALELRPLSGGGRRTQDGGLRLPPDTLPYVKRLRVSQS